MKIKDLFTGPETWCQAALAKNRVGEICQPDSSEAVCFFLSGAVIKCYLSDKQSQASPEAFISVYNAIHNRVKSAGGYDIFVWNDNEKRTFAEVKALVEELDI